MKIHEYQAKEIFRRFGVPTPRGEMVTSPEEARKVAQKLATPVVVVKAQIHAGGRGKGGGVKLARSADEAALLASKILGMNLVTPQTGPAGRIVRRLLIEEGLDIKRELYLSILVDRAVEAPVVMASAAGGMEIEEVAKENPAAILRETIRPALGLQPYIARKLAFGLGLTAEQAQVAVPFLQSLYRAFIETDSSLAEINPLVVTGDGRLIALDAKMNLDDNALYRHKDLLELRDLDEEDPLEVEASNYKLNYIKLDGTVGCMVNGAGLAMATMDIIKLAGGAPANFLDQITLDQIAAKKPARIVISPGPGEPQNAGICIDVIREFTGKIPILGVCLGHQAIGYAFGGNVVRAPALMHGKTSRIHHDSKTIFRKLPQDFVATRYHSLIVQKKGLPRDLEISAETDGLIMGLRHRRLPLEGVQFHPESVLTEVGMQMLRNFLSL